LLWRNRGNASARCKQDRRCGHKKEPQANYALGVWKFVTSVRLLKLGGGCRGMGRRPAGLIVAAFSSASRLFQCPPACWNVAPSNASSERASARGPALARGRSGQIRSADEMRRSLQRGRRASRCGLDGLRRTPYGASAPAAKRLGGIKGPLYALAALCSSLISN